MKTQLESALSYQPLSHVYLSFLFTFSFLCLSLSSDIPFIRIHLSLTYSLHCIIIHVGVGSSSDKRSNVDFLLQLRFEYEKLLQDAGVLKGITRRDLNRYNATVNKVFEQFRKEVESCHDCFVAKSYYDRCANFIGASTILNLVETKELVIDGPLHNAFSNKAHLQRVILKGKPFIFKYPLDLTNHIQVDSVMRDVAFSEMLRGESGENIFPGLVQYYRFQCTTNGLTVAGSISPIYVMSLNELNAPLPKNMILNMCQRIRTALDVIHHHGWIVGDIKPSNLFIASNGEIDIGDFGGAVPLKSELKEYSPDYLPADLIGPAKILVDYACLVVTVLEMIVGRPSISNLDALKASVSLVSDYEIRDMLTNYLLVNNVKL